MSGGHHQQAVLSAPERARYEGYFASADVDQDGVIGAADAAWFLQLGLEKSTLGEVWRMADSERRGYLSREEFYLALRLVALARLSRPLSVAEAAQPTAPQFHLQPQPASPAPLVTPSPPLSQGAPKLESTASFRDVGTISTSEEWTISAVERAKFAEIFDKADDDKDGYVTGPQARQLFSRSGLEMEDLGRIWTLSDVDQDHKLNQEEFIIAMYFINARLKGRPLPPVLPPSVYASASAAHHHPQPPKSGPAPTVPPVAATAPPSPAPAPTPALNPATTVPQAPLSHGAGHSDEEWVISQDERHKYEEVFSKADDDKDGYVLGEQARTMFSRSQLPLPDLAKIWSLSDYGQDHRLDKDEFVLAMFFINARLKGRQLPDVLPPSLVPASARLHHTPVQSPMFATATPSPPTSTGRRPVSTYGSTGLGDSFSMVLPSSPVATSQQNVATKPPLKPILTGEREPEKQPHAFPNPSGYGTLSPPNSGPVGAYGSGGFSGLASSAFGPADSFDLLAASSTSRPASMSIARPPASPQLQASLQAATQKEGDLKSRIDEVKTLAQQQYKLNEEFQKQLDVQIAKNLRLEEELAHEENRMNRLAEESLKLSAEFDKQKKEEDSIKAKLESTAEQSLAYATKLQEVQKQIQALQAELASETEQLQKAEKDAKKKKKRAARGEKEAESLRAQIAELRKQKAEVESNRAAMEERAHAAQSAKDKLHQELSQLSSDVAALENERANKQKQSDEAESQKRVLEEQRQQMEKEREQARASLAALDIRSQQQQQQPPQPQQLSAASPLPPRSGPTALPSYPGGWGSPVVSPSPPGSFHGQATAASPLASSGSKSAGAPLPQADPFGFFGGAFPAAQGGDGGAQVNFFDMASTGGIDPAETRDFFGGLSGGQTAPVTSPAPASVPTTGGFDFDPFASFNPPSQPSGPASDFFSTDDAFA